MQKFHCRMAGAVVFLLAWSSIALGQTTFGRVAGTVTDPSGASLPNARVVLANVGTTEQRTAVTDSTGSYEFVNLTPGTYRLDVELAGFKHFTRDPIVVEVQQTASVDVTMELGMVTQTVKVTAQTPLLQAETSSLGQVIETRQVNELPLNGRNAMNLVALAPSVVPQGEALGATTGVNIFAWANYQMGGAMTNQGAEYLDGVPLNNSYINLLSLVPTQDSIQEFKVQTNNLDAEWGRFAGGVINFTTKSGTDTMHGTAYEYLRNTVLNANDFFDKANGVPRAPFVQNQFGANAGGPFYMPRVYDGRNKTFWFASYEGFRLRRGAPFATAVPTAAERQGDYSSLLTSLGPQSGQLYDPTTTNTTTGDSRTPFQGNLIPHDRINSTALAMLKYIPLPNSRGLTDQCVLNNWAGNTSQGGDNDQFVIRGDENLSQKQHIFIRYTYWTNLNLGIDPFKTGLSVAAPEKFHTQDGVLDDVYSINQTTMLDMRVTFSRFVYNRTPQTLGVDLSQFGPNWASYQPEAFASVIPAPCFDNQYTNGGIECSGGASDVIVSAEDTSRVAGSLTKIKGRHSIQFGGEYRIDTYNYAESFSPVGSFAFSSASTSSIPIGGVGGDSSASMLLGY